MAKTLNQFLEGYLKVKNPDEQKFVDKHVIAKHSDRNGNGDEHFKGSKVKMVDRRKDRHGYNPGEDEKVYEELKGDQHKIDANKNGKLDAHDFKLLRKKKKVAEEAEQISEISDKTKLSYVTKSTKSIPQLQGKKGQLSRAYYNWHSGDEEKGKADKEIPALDKKIANRKQGIERAGKLLAKEEAEQIDELSKKTLGSYVKKAGGTSMNSVGYHGMVRSASAPYGKNPDEAEYKKSKRVMDKRAQGIMRAADKLTKEEAEQIDELSRDTLRRYRMKSKSIGDNEKGDIGYRSKGRDLAARKSHGGQWGIPKAKVMAKEEAELEEKLTAKTPMGTYIKDFQKSDAPQFKGKSEKKRRVMAIAAKLSAERGGKPLRKEEKLADLLDDLSESHRRTMLTVFEKLNESNQKKFLEACETPEGVEYMLDFAINHRGE